jgi:hypothetical protein
MGKPTRESDMKACHTMNQRSTKDKWIQMDEVRYGLQGHNNLVATNGMIDGNQVIKDTMMMVLPIYTLAQG